MPITTVTQPRTPAQPGPVEDANRQHFDAVFSDPQLAHGLRAQGLLTYSSGEGRWLARRVHRLTGMRLPAGARVLELGGGSGYASVNLACGGDGVQLTLLDLSFSAVSLSLRMSARQGIQGFGVQANAMQLPFPDATFDAVIGRSFVHHIPDLPGLLRDSCRVVKPGGGVLFFSEPAQPGSERLRVFKRAYGRLIHRGRSVDGEKALVGTARYVRSSEEIERVFKQLGLDGQVVESGITAKYALALWYPVLLKLKLPALSALVNRAVKPCVWLDDRWLRHWLVRWNCEQWLVLRRPPVASRAADA